MCERRVAGRRGARAGRSLPVSPIPNPDPNPTQAPQMSLKDAKPRSVCAHRETCLWRRSMWFRGARARGLLRTHILELIVLLRCWTCRRLVCSNYPNSVCVRACAVCGGEESSIDMYNNDVGKRFITLTSATLYFTSSSS